MLTMNVKETKMISSINIELSFLISYFLCEQKEVYKKSTYQGRKEITKKYIEPYFAKGETLFDCFSMVNVENFKHSIYSSSLSISRKNLIYSTFKSMITYAEERDFLPYEFGEKIKRIIKSIRKDKEISKKIVFWTPEEFNKFIRTFKKDSDYKWKIFFLITYWAGLRMGEVIALTWADLDLLTKTISINKSIDRDNELLAPKNQSSNASVDLPTFMVKLLEEYKEKVNPFSDNEYMFFNNTPVPRTNIRRKMDSHAKMAKLQHIKFHGLRHSIASRMINYGLNPLIVSKHLRHSSTQQTLDTYSHLFPKITQGIMDKLIK